MFLLLEERKRRKEKEMEKKREKLRKKKGRGRKRIWRWFSHFKNQCHNFLLFFSFSFSPSFFSFSSDPSVICVSIIFDDDLLLMLISFIGEKKKKSERNKKNKEKERKKKRNQRQKIKWFGAETNPFIRIHLSHFWYFFLPFLLIFLPTFFSLLSSPFFVIIRWSSI